MHAAALHLAPVLAAEKSRVPFFIAGGLLAAWALVVSLGLGLRRPQFPGNLGGERVVIAISLVLVLAAMSTAVISSGSPAKASEPSAQAPGASTEKGAAPNAPATPNAPGGSAAGSSSPSSSSPPATSSTPASAPAAHSALSLSASTTTIAYSTKQLRAKAGTVTITFNNPGALEHNVTVGQGSSVLGATPTFSGGTKTLTLNLKPGTYSFYCTVPGHRAAGMEGTLTVT
jgi:plastocyanin